MFYAKGDTSQKHLKISLDAFGMCPFLQLFLEGVPKNISIRLCSFFTLQLKIEFNQKFWYFFEIYIINLCTKEKEEDYEKHNRN